MGYTVLKDFTDSVDKKVLRKGDVYPNKETKYEPSDERIAYLMGSDNKHKESLIGVTMDSTKADIERVATIQGIEYDSKDKKEDIFKLIEGA